MDALLAFCDLDEASARHEGPGAPSPPQLSPSELRSLHDARMGARKLLEEQLGMLRLRAANDRGGGDDDDDGDSDDGDIAAKVAKEVATMKKYPA